MRAFMRHPFKGIHFYEWQIGPFVFQVKRGDNPYAQHPRFTVWRDPHWRS